MRRYMKENRKQEERVDHTFLQHASPWDDGLRHTYHIAAWLQNFLGTFKERNSYSPFINQ